MPPVPQWVDTLLLRRCALVADVAAASTLDLKVDDELSPGFQNKLV